MLGSPDPKVRDDTAFPVLAYWVSRGVFDGELASVGDDLIAWISEGPILSQWSCGRNLARAFSLTPPAAFHHQVG